MSAGRTTAFRMPNELPRILSKINDKNINLDDESLPERKVLPQKGNIIVSRKMNTTAMFGVHCDFESLKKGLESSLETEKR